METYEINYEDENFDYGKYTVWFVRQVYYECSTTEETKNFYDAEIQRLQPLLLEEFDEDEKYPEGIPWKNELSKFVNDIIFMSKGLNAEILDNEINEKKEEINEDAKLDDAEKNLLLSKFFLGVRQELLRGEDEFLKESLEKFDRYINKELKILKEERELFIEHQTYKNIKDSDMHPPAENQSISKNCKKIEWNGSRNQLVQFLNLLKSDDLIEDAGYENLIEDNFYLRKERGASQNEEKYSGVKKNEMKIQWKGTHSQIVQLMKLLVLDEQEYDDWKLETISQMNPNREANTNDDYLRAKYAKERGYSNLVKSNSKLVLVIDNFFDAKNNGLFNEALGNRNLSKVNLKTAKASSLASIRNIVNKVSKFK